MPGPKHLDPKLGTRIRLLVRRGIARHARPAMPATDEALEVFLPWVADRSRAAGFGDDIEGFLRSGRSDT